MKKLVFASVMALASISLVYAPTLRDQDSGTITIKDPVEYKAYSDATGQSDPKALAAALESFLTTYPQSVVKQDVLNRLLDAYQKLGDGDHALSAASRLLQVDPGNFKAILISLAIKKGQCQKSEDPKTGYASDPAPCDDAAALAQKGLTAAKPADTSAPDWKNQTAVAYPIFDSAIAVDDTASKKDLKAAEDEFAAELMLYTDDQSKTAGLQDTLLLAQAYGAPGPGHDLIKAVWFYARAYDFAPPNFKTQIEPLLEYWYKRYHGTLDGDPAIKQQIAAIETQAQATLFPPDGFTIAPAPTPADLAHHAYTSGDPKALSLEDKEYILANGSDADATGLWALLKGQPTPVPGIVIADPANALKISVTTTASVKPKDYVVKLTNPVACNAVPAPPSELKVADVQAYILANGVKADTDAMGDALTDTPAHIHKISIDPGILTLNVAVTQDAKDAHTADFTVNLKDPLSCKDAPAAGSALGLQPAIELDGTYDTYTHTAAAGSTAASAQIVLSDGFVQPEKKAGPVHHVPAKPSAAHHAQ